MKYLSSLLKREVSPLIQGLSANEEVDVKLLQLEILLVDKGKRLSLFCPVYFEYVRDIMFLDACNLCYSPI